MCINLEDFKEDLIQLKSKHEDDPKFVEVINSYIEKPGILKLNIPMMIENYIFTYLIR
jgi:hypothetical protein